MAKKPSSRGKVNRRPVDQSAAKGGGIMSINKSHTSPFMKVVLIVIIISMITLFLAGGIAGFVDLFKAQPKAATVDPIIAAKNQFEPRAQAFANALASSPASYTLLVNLGNTRYDYAVTLLQLVSKGTTSAMLPAVQQWTAARDAFGKAYKIKKTDLKVGVDYSVATFYSGDTTQAVKIVSGVIKQDPKFAPAYFNLGIFYDAQGDVLSAIVAYQTYVTLDPKGQSGDPSYAKRRISSLESTSAIGGGATIATGTATSTP